MIRALGFLVGLAAVATPVAAWLLVTGRVAPPPPAPPAVAEAPRPSAPPPPEPALPPPGPAQSPLPEAPAEAPAGEALAPPADAAPDPAAPPDAGGTVEIQVWRPFRSERAARGFAGHIAGRYGADARVERAGPGDYRVMVGAGSPEALEATLARLRSDAGLARLEPRP